MVSQCILQVMNLWHLMWREKSTGVCQFMTIWFVEISHALLNNVIINTCLSVKYCLD